MSLKQCLQNANILGVCYGFYFHWIKERFTKSVLDVACRQLLCFILSRSKGYQTMELSELHLSDSNVTLNQVKDTESETPANMYSSMYSILCCKFWKLSLRYDLHGWPHQISCKYLHWKLSLEPCQRKCQHESFVFMPQRYNSPSFHRYIDSRFIPNYSILILTVWIHK